MDIDIRTVLRASFSMTVPVIGTIFVFICSYFTEYNNISYYCLDFEHHYINKLHFLENKGNNTAYI